MTFQPKKRKRAKRQHEKHRSIKNRSKEILFIDHRLTEQRNAASRNLDRMTAMEIVRLMNREDRKVAIAVGRELPAIARAVEAIVGGSRPAPPPPPPPPPPRPRVGALDAAQWPP